MIYSGVLRKNTSPSHILNNAYPYEIVIIKKDFSEAYYVGNVSDIPTQIKENLQNNTISSYNCLCECELDDQFAFFRSTYE
jgi:hypothetical protein